MESSILLFIAALRRQGVRVSTAEALDAIRCAAVPGMLASRQRLHAALRAAIVTQPAQLDTFDAVFELFFTLRPITRRQAPADAALSGEADEPGTGGEGGDTDEAHTLDRFEGTGPERPGHTPPDTPNLRDAFDPESLRSGRGFEDDDTSLVDLSAPSEELAFSTTPSRGAGLRVQLDLARSHGQELPGALTGTRGQELDLQLTADEEQALLGWLGADPASGQPADDAVTGLLDRLPAALAEHLRHLVELRQGGLLPEQLAPAVIDEVSEAEREAFEQSLRRLARSLQGGLAQKRRASPAGQVHPALTTRRSLRYDGVPFQPVTVQRVRERSRVIVLADVSLSVRPTARFTLRMVHSMHRAFGRARTFAFVDELVEITGLFEAHPIEHALGLVFGGKVLDTEGSSDYGTVFGQLLDDEVHLDRRTSLIVVGDGRSNGRDPGLEAFAELARRLRRVLWLTPEPSYSWGLGSCALPEYAAYCERVEVVRDVGGLERTAERMVAA